MTGSIPSEIGLLSSLVELKLGGWNYEYATSQAETITMHCLFALTIFALCFLFLTLIENNALSGPIPTEIGKLTTLESLWLGG